MSDAPCHDHRAKEFIRIERREDGVEITVCEVEWPSPNEPVSDLSANLEGQGSANVSTTLVATTEMYCFPFA